MLIKAAPDIDRKLDILGGAAKFDLACGTCGEGRKRDLKLDKWIYPSVMPDGRVQLMLKVLMSNACRYNCLYCAQRANRSSERTTFKPDQLAGLFGDLWHRKKAHGLFLSSSIYADTTTVMDAMLKTAELVRSRYHFTGYLHLKLLPGIEDAQIERAIHLADRVSVNFETTCDQRLARIAPEKRLSDSLEKVMNTAHHLLKRKTRHDRCKGLTTQFVVGPAGESDRELVEASGRIYRQLNLKRIYFSAHNPVPDTPLAEVKPTPLWRENRLYQADFLLREYGFAPKEFVFDENEGFDPRSDPKTSWAHAHPEYFPLEINTAAREQLLRIPGIGPIGSKRILAARKETRLHYPEQLKAMGVRERQAAPFLLFDGRRRAPGATLDLFYDQPALSNSEETGRTR